MSNTIHRFFLVFIIFPIYLFASSAEIDLSQSSIVIPKKMTKLNQKALSILQEEILIRTGIHLKTSTKWPEMQQPVIVIVPVQQIEDLAGPYKKHLNGLKTEEKEGFYLIFKETPHPALFVIGNDSRGILYGIGKLLRCLYLKSGIISLPKSTNISSAPRYPIRGHQLGYRPKTNAYDAWDIAQYDQYIRELALFGANCIEIMPPRTDDQAISVHMKTPAMQMMIKHSEIIDAYGMDVWIWYPNMGSDYSHPDSIAKELKERDEIFSQLKRIDVVFVPGGDPGDLHPNILFSWLARVAEVLNKYHPKAKMWVSPQAFRPTSEWLDAFYDHVNRKYSWFGGVVFGPWVKTSLPEIRKIVDRQIPIRRYPDITHSISCQYPVKDWDLAYAMTLGRECYNPRPLAEKIIHNALDEFADGSLSYSEGINDDVNKFIWSSLDWNPEALPLNILREYSRLFISPDHFEEIAQGILSLEKNWQGALLSNKAVPITLQQWQTLEKTVTDDIRKKYRFQMCLLRAYYDAYVRERLIHETELERQAVEILRGAPNTGSEKALTDAESILTQKWDKAVAQDYKERCWQIADYLFASIGSQTSVAKHNARDGRGNFMDYMDVPLNDAIWFLANFSKIRVQSDEKKRLMGIERLINRTNPGAGGFYDNLGRSATIPRLAHYPDWEIDPGSLKSPRVSFGVGLRGEEWVHTVQAKGFDGSATPLAWMNQVTTLYDTPLILNYDELDPQSGYILRVAYTGRFRSKIRLTADDQFLLHDLIQTGITPLMEFPIPPEAIQDSKLTLTWTAGEGERGAQIAEVWLMRVDK